LEILGVEGGWGRVEGNRVTKDDDFLNKPSGRDFFNLSSFLEESLLGC
jgi:hypothetical protein